MLKRKLSEKKIENLIGIAISLLVFIIYWTTLAPTVSFIDSGELATVVTILGIAHPTGYPLFTLVGHIFSMLPIANEIIYRLNLMAAFFCASSIFFFYKLILLLVRETYLVDTGNFPQKIDRNNFYAYVPAIAGAFILAFSKTFWAQATSIEVYSIHTFFLSLLLFVLTKAMSLQKTTNRSQGKGGIEINKYWLLFVFLLGLSFSNHMTTILLVPGVLYIYFATFGFSKSSLRAGVSLGITFFLGLTVYLYLPIRAASSPSLNWGNPVDLEKIIWHVSGKQFRIWMFSSMESAGKQFNYFIHGLPNEFYLIFLPALVIGVFLTSILFIGCVFYVLKDNTKIFFLTSILFISCVFYSINYDIHDIDSYFLLAYFSIAIWISLGIGWTIRKIQKKVMLIVVSVLIVIAGLVPVYLNYKQNDESKNYLVEDYTKNVFDCIEPNGIILSYQWDYFVSASYYMQTVEKYRRDIIVIDKELLRRSWYFKQLLKLYPEIIKKSIPEIEAFLLELYKFEHELPYSFEIIEQRYSEVIKSIIEKNIDSRPIYVTAEIEPQYLAGYEKVPTGLCFRLTKPGKEIAAKYYFLNYKKADKFDPRKNVLDDLYLNAYANNAIYQMQHKNIDIAIKYLDEALAISPTNNDLLSKRNYLLGISGRSMPNN
jgi:hypothetical protein